MKKINSIGLVLILSVAAFAGCQVREREEANQDYLEVIGEYEQQTPEAGYRLNLSYNGPIEQREKFLKWADSVKQVVPSMVKMNEGIYLNYMPEQMGKKISRDMYQTSVTYLLTVSDSSLYSSLTEDLLERNIPFNLNVMGTFMEPEQKTKLQHQMLQKAMENARAKLDFMISDGREYEIIGIEELDNTTPYGPEYYDFNRRMVARVKVKASLK
ncbi:SIMPL domain-containing protein [Pontibacter locisalis]|uniref:SIMPL domain-containing protein n=1 Tax=Pontibacter locisalis TaxID=1719035 RepID=A0ABW5INE6_9BACT